MTTVQLDQQAVAVSTIFCVGRNYTDHIAELGNVPDVMPLVFLKPQGALLGDGGHIILPAWSGDVHHECELVLLIGQDADNVPAERALEVVAGYGIGLDMTARDVQTELKQKGHPWTRAKGFRGAACVSRFVPANKVEDPLHLRFCLRVNDQVRQRGETSMMIVGLTQLVAWLSSEYGLKAGDLIYTGTPAGVGPVHAGDVLQAELCDLVHATWQVD